LDDLFSRLFFLAIAFQRARLSRKRVFAVLAHRRRWSDLSFLDRAGDRLAILFAAGLVRNAGLGFVGRRSALGCHRRRVFETRRDGLLHGRVDQELGFRVLARFLGAGRFWGGLIWFHNVAGQRLRSLAADRIVITARRGSFADPSRHAFHIVRGALRALFLGNECLPISDRDLVIIRMDFAESEETVAVAAVVDEGGLQ